jgi:hypothetical protein
MKPATFMKLANFLINPLETVTLLSFVYPFSNYLKRVERKALGKYFHVHAQKSHVHAKKVRPLSKIRQIKDHSPQAIIFLVSLRPNLHDFKKEPWHSMAQQSLAKVPQTIPFWNVHLLSH